MSFVQTTWWSFTYLVHSEMHDKSTVHWSSAHLSGWIRFTLDISRGHVSCIEVEHTSVYDKCPRSPVSLITQVFPTSAQEAQYLSCSSYQQWAGPEQIGLYRTWTAQFFAGDYPIINSTKNIRSCLPCASFPRNVLVFREEIFIIF